MAIQIRTQVFETNSSSMHSIAVRKGHERLTPEDAKEVAGQAWLHNGYKTVWSHNIDFERYPFKMLYTMWDKALYAVASVLGGYAHRLEDDEEAKEFLEGQLYPIIRKYCPEFKGFTFEKESQDILIDPSKPDTEENIHFHWDSDVSYRGEEFSPSGYVLVQEGDKYVPLSVDEEHYIETMQYGYVDHQSEGLFRGFLKASGVSLEDFLTDSAYVVVIDGDEYDDFGDYLKNGILRPEDFETVYTSNPWWGRGLKDKLGIQPVSCGDT